MKAEVNITVRGLEEGNLIKTTFIPFGPPIGYKLDLALKGGDHVEDCEVVGATWVEDGPEGYLIIFCESDGLLDGELERVKKDPEWKIE